MPDGPFVDTQQLRAQHSVVYTSDYVLDEVITLLFRRVEFAEAVRFLEGLLLPQNAAISESNV